MKLLSLALILTAMLGVLPAGGRDLSKLKIVPHPSGGMYLGQYEWLAGDIAAFEAAGGRKTALWSRHYGSWSVGYDSKGEPHFDLKSANLAWAEGKVIIVQMYNTSPAPGETEAPPGFTVDKLLRGHYDAQMRRFAAELRGFGKPMFFTAGREPNGIGADYFGGFGPRGDKPLRWALEYRRGFDQFKAKNAGNDAVCDGVERLKAAQRYYHDFFVRREGLKFLTFDTMGWAVHRTGQLQDDLAELPAHIDKAYALKLLQSCNDFRNFYPGDGYADWVSLTFYMLDYYKADFPELERDYVIPIADHLFALGKAMKDVKAAAAKKPVFLMELGFPDGRKRDSAWAAKKVAAGLAHMTNAQPQIKGFAMWSWHPAMDRDFPYYSLIRPKTRQGAALQKVLSAYGRRFHSCVYLSDGKVHPQCRK